MSTPTIDIRGILHSDDLPGVVAGVTTSAATIGLEATGPRLVGESETLAADAVLALFSTTKPLTSTLALQLVDDGVLDLDAPAAEYEPRLGGIGVLDGVDDDGTVRLHEPSSPVTLRRLLTHTAGFGYDFFDADLAAVVRARSLPDIATATLESLQTPLLFDPGTRWEYGMNIDWAGLVIEAVTGRRLGEVMRERLFEPLGMHDTTFARDERLLDRAATLHARTPDGAPKALRAPSRPDAPELDMGGQGAYSTAADYLRFLRMWLNDGRTDSGEQVLSAQMVAEATRDQLGDLQVTALPGVNPRLTNPVEFFPGHRKGWGLIAMTNTDDAPTGRRAGSLGWAGLANLYFWLDRTSDVAGFWATQLFPFADHTAMTAALDFETAVYRAR
ncbi:serine hydrolase domain-containing protein [Gordonia sp. NB41Y]|uniref:serine hydrolase domain-containing protein n=1 Tax=Gordonia sp. NB41Y TaxID=875808 RepID=UPI0006B1F3AC|nr:serine hydrolase domain-containing protein [Gordonia sp. NB41Y]EMP12842.2 1,4-butanediol diacrylate esterase [Gordonia sp. NB41Y]WLP89834.1 serine hydrolase domain-containing protein [Gordonia sp. NB41Y]